MRQLVGVSLWGLVSGCLDVTVDDKPGGYTGPSTALHLTVHVTSDASQILTRDDGTKTIAQQFEKDYARSESRPDAVVLPLALDGLSVIAPLDGGSGCPASGLASEKVQLVSIQPGDDQTLNGSYVYSCTYSNGDQRAGSMPLWNLGLVQVPPL